MLLPATRSPLWLAFGVTIAFTLLAYHLRGVDLAGALAGAPICFVLYACAGLGAFLGLVSVFALSWVATRVGYRRKEQLGTAEKRSGRRASQVFANLGVAAMFALAFGLSKHPAWLAGAAAALAEAAADTVSSEIGQIAGGGARLITTGEVVPAGTDGGVSLLGSAAGLVAAAFIAAVCAGAALIPSRATMIVVISAVLGMFFDSLIGALFERRGWLGNDSVNFLGTLSAALGAFLWASFR